ncbi:MAG: IclR family transcriptional regulator [Hydrogenophaga sp.]|jgi:DNA-binding IclR family transcriptional regulator|uniref:IclR family transcriptional regulator n=1 Tax=Hydrogenophaga sp. TaxID=1904254 RepID=UPI001DC13684|nr:IclR family transcriptional regulator [Hydrogenophaga sp.]MBW0169276.1 IclR family transcriptional regulator [Hydrogenophaga sp.]MBW0183588.1 IclR family transcriptional regulator [Hydrogenophaga sp.]
MNTDTEVSPGLRLLELLDLLARENTPQALPDVVAKSGWPKPTVHRMLTQLEAGGWLVREPDGRHFALAPRLLRLSEAALSSSTLQGVRHAVLRQLVSEVGESCNLTALSGAEVIYLDRVESAFPLRMELRPGTRVPVHCSASGKLFLAWMGARQRRTVLDGLDLRRYTASTLTGRDALEAELETIRRDGHAVDAEEFVEGLVCVAVPVFAPGQTTVRCALALQAPAARMTLAQARLQLPRLQTAAQALARTLG